MLFCQHVKQVLGRSCIYVGGVLQLYFGITGSRWKDPSVVASAPVFMRSRLSGQHPNWTHVLPEDMPSYNVSHRFAKGFNEMRAYW